jgi:hypothetical protein
MVSQHEDTPTSCTKWFFSMNILLPAIPNGCSPWTHSYQLYQMVPQHEHTPTSCTKWFFSMNILLPAIPNSSSAWTHSYQLYQMVYQHEHTPTSCTVWFFTMDTLLPVTPNVSLAWTHSYHQLYQKDIPERTHSILATLTGLSAWTLFYKLHQRVSKHEASPTGCSNMNVLLLATACRK